VDGGRLAAGFTAKLGRMPWTKREQPPLMTTSVQSRTKRVRRIPGEETRLATDDARVAPRARSVTHLTLRPATSRCHRRGRRATGGSRSGSRGGPPTTPAERAHREARRARGLSSGSAAAATLGRGAARLLEP